MDFERIRKTCEAVARRKGFPQDAEDFAGFVLLDIVEHKRDAVFIEHRFVDFLRKHYGRTGTPGGDAKQRARLGSGATSSEDVASDAPSGPHTSQIGRRIALILGTERQRHIAGEVLDAERSVVDVAGEIGVSPSRVSQVLGPVKQRIQEVIILEEYLPDFLEDTERQTLAIKWIEL